MSKTKTYIESYIDRFTGEYVEHVIDVDTDPLPVWRGKSNVPDDPWADPKTAWQTENAPF